MHLGTLLLAAALLVGSGCTANAPESTPATPDLVGEWAITWMEGFEFESLKISRTSSPEQGYSLAYSAKSCVGPAVEFQRKAIRIGGALLLDRVYNHANHTYIALAIDTREGEFVLVPYPNPQVPLGPKKAEAMYRRFSPLRGRPSSDSIRMDRASVGH